MDSVWSYAFIAEVMDPLALLGHCQIKTSKARLYMGHRDTQHV